MKANKANKKGFTLVELIIVIAVMAVLAAIVVPRMAGISDTFKYKGDKETCGMYARVLEAKVQLGDLTLTDSSDTKSGQIDNASVGETTVPQIHGLSRYSSDNIQFFYHITRTGAATAVDPEYTIYVFVGKSATQPIKSSDYSIESSVTFNASTFEDNYFGVVRKAHRESK